jgi:predicted transglutaminase-like cysteine proteinase
MIPYSLLDAVNFQVNKDIKYTRDGLYDYWAKAVDTERTRKGDCEDIAIVKANRLANLHHCNKKDMRIGKFQTPGGTYHAMLVVEGEDTKGFFRKKTFPCRWVLDNRWDAIYRIDQIRDKLILEYDVDLYI